MFRPLVPFALLVAAVGTFVTTQQRPPKTALVYRNDCPHEPPCAESLWVAGQRLTTYARLNDRSRRSFSIAKDQRIEFDSGVIVVDAPGRLVIAKPEGRYQVGDTVYLLGYEGEGAYRAWHRDSVLSVSFPFDHGSSVRVLDRPGFTWWAAVRDNAGRRAWVPLRNVEVDGIGFEEIIDMTPSRNRR